MWKTRKIFEKIKIFYCRKELQDPEEEDSAVQLSA